MSKTPEYRAWHGMKARCLNPKTRAFKNYGGRGITVCARWMSFSNFYADMGPRPPGMTLERQENNGPYSPTNCRWATLHDQLRNRRNTRLIACHGKMYVLPDLAAAYGIPLSALRTRLERCGWTPERAVATPVTTNYAYHERLFTLDGKTQNLMAWAKHAGLSYTTLAGRLNKGMPLAEAIASPAKPRDRELEHRGERLTVAQWAKRLGIPAPRIYRRLAAGWTVEATLTEEMQGERRLTCDGENLPVSRWAARLGIPKDTIYKRLQYGWTEEESLSLTKRARRPPSAAARRRSAPGA